MGRVKRMKMTSKRTQSDWTGRSGKFNHVRHSLRAFLCKMGVSLMSQASRASSHLIG